MPVCQTKTRRLRSRRRAFDNCKVIDCAHQHRPGPINTGYITEYAAGTIKVIEKLKTRLHGRPGGSELFRDRNEVCAKVNTVTARPRVLSLRNCFFNFSPIITLKCLNSMLYFLQIKGGIIDGILSRELIPIDKKKQRKRIKSNRCKGILDFYIVNSLNLLNDERHMCCNIVPTDTQILIVTSVRDAHLNKLLLSKHIGNKSADLTLGDIGILSFVRY